jgi:chromosome partitioning protein
MRVIAIINQKGGCGKTTVSINLASCLSELGKRTLLIDMDPQSHCAVGLAVPEEQIEQSIYDVLISASRGEPVNLNEILWEISERFELAPASIDLTAFEQQMTGIIDRENCLVDVFKSVKDRYDYIVIDCPPAVGLLTFNAIRAATDVIVPVETGYFSLHGLSKQLETLSILCKQCSQKINVMVLASMYDIRTKMAREILGELRKHFSSRMFKTIVNFNTKLKEATSLGQPVNEYDPVCKGHKDFQELAGELVGTDTGIDKFDLLASEKAESREAAPEAIIEDVLESAPSRTEAISTLSEELAAIGTSAEELLDTIETEKQKKQMPAVAKADLDKKLADFYGVRQVGGAVNFVTLYPRAKQVQIAGDFNNWQPEQTTMKNISGDGKWQLMLPLGPGKYHYRLVVDGQWQQDPYNEQLEINPFGEFNSVVKVK